MSFLIAKEAPNFTEKAILGDNTVQEKFILKDYAAGSKLILFFYPLNFTFVCPSEIIAFNHKIYEFDKRNTKVVGVSIDSHFSHLQYKNTDTNNGGIGQVKFPLVADISKNIARNYDVLFNQEIALRGTFLIDENFIVRHMIVNDLPLGRNIDEALRMVDALSLHQNNGDVCPANWRHGKPAITPTTEGIKQYLSENHNKL